MNRSLFLAAAKGLAVGVGLTLILLLAGSAVALNTPDPDTAVSILAHSLRLLGGAFIGFLAARFHREQGLLTGGVAGLLYALLLLLGAAITPGHFSLLSALLLGLASLTASVLGGVLGVPGEKSDKAKRKALMKRMGQ